MDSDGPPFTSHLQGCPMLSPFLGLHRGGCLGTFGIGASERHHDHRGGLHAGPVAAQPNVTVALDVRDGGHDQQLVVDFNLGMMASK